MTKRQKGKKAKRQEDKKTKRQKDIQSTWVPSGAGNNRVTEGA